jgi:hypothetical protein
MRPARPSQRKGSVAARYKGGSESDPLAPLDLAGDDCPPSSDLVLLLLLFFLVTSSDALVPRCRSPSSSAAHQLGPVIESHDPGARPLADGAVWQAYRRSSRLSHRLFRFDGVLEPKGLPRLKEVLAAVLPRRGK